MRYTFGDTPTACERLERIADFFNPLARDFVESHLDREVGCAVDLGCGPGFTTEMLAEATGAMLTCGLDQSDDFIEIAKKRCPAFRFYKHDVTQAGFPVPGDAMYCRFLLSHLRDTDRVVRTWLEELSPGGQLFIDELESVETSHPIFREYLDVNQGLVRSQGAELYVGPTLNRTLRDLPVTANRLTEIPVPNHRAAAWFHPNTATVWETEPYVAGRLSLPERARIRDHLAAMMETPPGPSDITWKMRRMVLKR